jgi:hypothetical protein
MIHDSVAILINNMLRDVLLAKECVMINMVQHGLSPSGGWRIGQSFEIDQDGNMIQDFVPVLGADARGGPPQVRPDLGVRVIIKVPRPRSP